MTTVVLTIPTLQQGGAERVISILANHWSLSGISVTIILFSDEDIFFDLHPGVKIHSLSIKNRSKLLRYIFSLIKMRLLIKEIGPNFILSFITPFNLFTLLSLIGANQNVFVSDRANLNTKRTLIERLLKPVLYRFSKGVIAQTTDAKNIIYNQTKHPNIKVIPNPISILRDTVNHLEREKIILNVGRMVPEKGQKYLLEAFSKIQDLNYRLVILGDGPLKSDLESLAQKLKISERVEFQGTVKNVRCWLEKSSIFAFTSISEGFPNALAEAMSSGLACISFDCDSGPRDLIKSNFNGILIPVKDVEKLTFEMNRLINDKDLAYEMGLNAGLSVEKLDAKVIARDTMKFLCKTIEN